MGQDGQDGRRARRGRNKEGTTCSKTLPYKPSLSYELWLFNFANPFTPLHPASADAWTRTTSLVVWLRGQEPRVHGLSVLGFGHYCFCVLID
jgi:hypothetical protein